MEQIEKIFLSGPEFSCREEALLCWAVIILSLIAFLIYVVRHSEWWQNRRK